MHIRDQIDKSNKKRLLEGKELGAFRCNNPGCTRSFAYSSGADHHMKHAHQLKDGDLQLYGITKCKVLG